MITLVTTSRLPVSAFNLFACLVYDRIAAKDSHQLHLYYLVLIAYVSMLTH